MKSKIMMPIMVFFIIQHSNAAPKDIPLQVLMLFSNATFECTAAEGNNTLIDALKNGKEGDIIPEQDDVDGSDDPSATTDTSNTHKIYKLYDMIFSKTNEASDDKDESSDDSDTNTGTKNSNDIRYRYITGSTKLGEKDVEAAALFSITGNEKVEITQIVIDTLRVKEKYKGPLVDCSVFINDLPDLIKENINLYDTSKKIDAEKPKIPPKGKVIDEKISCTKKEYPNFPDPPIDED